MKKIVSITVATIATLTLMSGCSTTKEVSAGLETGDATICKTAIYVGDRSTKSVLNAVESAGIKEGWRMTGFKTNSIIAEKEIGSETYSTTIVIAKEHIMCDKDKASQNDLKALRYAIIDELQAKKY